MPCSFDSHKVPCSLTPFTRRQSSLEGLPRGTLRPPCWWHAISVCVFSIVFRPKHPPSLHLQPRSLQLLKLILPLSVSLTQHRMIVLWFRFSGMFVAVHFPPDSGLEYEVPQRYTCRFPDGSLHTPRAHTQVFLCHWRCFFFCSPYRRWLVVHVEPMLDSRGRIGFKDASSVCTIHCLDVINHGSLCALARINESTWD